MFSTTARHGLPYANLPSPPTYHHQGGRGCKADASCRYLPPLGGLTPPSDEMSAACHQQQPMGPYEAHAMSTYPPTAGYAHPERENASFSGPTYQPQPQSRYTTTSHVMAQSQAAMPLATQQQQQQQQQQRQPVDGLSQPQPRSLSRLPTLDQLESRALASRGLSMPRLATTLAADGRSSVTLCSESATLSRSTTPSSAATMVSLSKEFMSRQLTDHSSEIPDFISPRGGSLADFVAQMASFFWFESIDVLRVAELRTKGGVVRRLHADSMPQAGFKKWCYNILSTTQVTRNVVLLALLFIYRLKKLNPTVKGRGGSEYRLVTVALMLGNKFLDDNTYTNKTWADVSMISVTDIHLMEVEFLSNMRYSLLTTKGEWEDWLEKLGSFYEYYAKAMDMVAATPTMAMPSSPSHTAMYRSPLASPTTTGHNFGPATPTAYSPSPVAHTASSQNWVSTSSPLSNKPAMAYGIGNARKRSYDGDATEPPAKRLAHHPQYPVSLPSSLPRPGPLASSESSRLTVPSLTINTNAALPTPASTAYTPTSNLTPSHVSLPPLSLGMRAMSTVYTAQTAGPPSQHLPAPVPAATSAMLASSVAFAPSGLPAMQHGVLGYATPTKAQNPAGMAPAMYNSSPTNEPYQPGSAVHTPIIHTPIANSPSIYLQQRPSPYKPIRNVKTLLRPPPSGSLHEYHLSVPPQLPPSQMHYQPLGRRNDLRTGIVPEFMHAPYLGSNLVHGSSVAPGGHSGYRQQ